MRSLILVALVISSTAWSSPEENLLGQSGFEEPQISGRTPETDEGLLPVESETSPWSYFSASSETDGGRIIVGLTNEIARTGRQSIYVDFEKVTAKSRVAVLMTKLIPVKPSQAYRVSIWGRIDRKRPLSLDERRPFTVLDVDFFSADGKTKAGEPIRGFQLIPGRIIPGGPHPLTFVAKKWSESSSQFSTPEGAALLKVTWKWQVPTDEGETDGVIYWDDATLVEDNSPPPEKDAVQTGGASANQPALEQNPAEKQ
jgi:hypothetical protein